MATAERRAEIYWEGRLDRGAGSFTFGSWMLGELPVTWESRVAPEYDSPSPEELMAAAQASCFSMALFRAGRGRLDPGDDEREDALYPRRG